MTTIESSDSITVSFEDLPVDVRREVRKQRSFVQLPASAAIMWREILTEAQRAILGGDLEAAYLEEGQTLGMWHRVSGDQMLKGMLGLAKKLSVLDDRKYNWLTREIGEEAAGAVQPLAPPSWNRELRELRLGGKIVRRVRFMKKRTHVELILAVFEEQGWPEIIDDPLPEGPLSERLRDAVKSLNQGLLDIRFDPIPSGEGIRWYRV